VGLVAKREEELEDYRWCGWSPVGRGISGWRMAKLSRVSCISCELNKASQVRAPHGLCLTESRSGEDLC
jgi:hypothetical protein